MQVVTKIHARQDGKTDETDLADLNGSFERVEGKEIRFYPFHLFNPFSHPAYSAGRNSHELR
jgi:hypothetical protein